MDTPERTTAAAFPRYLHGQVLADSAALQWPSLYARRFRCLRVVERFLVPATVEPLIFHLKRARENGVTEPELIEAITHLAFYSGWPKAMSALAVAQEAFQPAKP